MINLKHYNSLLWIFLLIFTASCENDTEEGVNVNFVASTGFSDTDASIRYSENGIYWSTNNITPMSQNYLINALAYGDDHFVAVGNGIYSYQSTDGANWTQTNLDSIKTYTDIAVGEYHNQSPWAPYFVAVGNRGAVMYSSNHGNSWTSGNSGVISKLNGIAFGNTVDGLSMFVAVGDAPTLTMVGAPEQGTIIYSLTAGESWIQHSTGGSYSNLHCIAFGNGRFIAAGNYGYIIYSTNGAAWQYAESNGTKTIYGLAYGIADGSPIWVGVGASGTVLHSTDNGNNWTEDVFDEDKTWCSVIYADNRFYAVGYGSDGGLTNGVEGKIIYSNDGVNWSQAAVFAEFENYFSDIAYRNSASE
ncbi:MAG: hypothetical protein MI922_27665 [Bacteroidales bacterium]|nr:hypothetical protein [Bacteroidales bacterium]